MKRFVPKDSRQPESRLQEKIVRMLRLQEWTVIPTHGNLYQGGFPDLYCFHYVYGVRWVEVKIEERVSFTKYQLYYFPLMRNVWVLCGTSDQEYLKLFRPPNVHRYMEIFLNKNNVTPMPKKREVQDHQEGIWQEELCKYLETKKFICNPTYGNNIQRGLPDVFLIKGTRTWWLELKRHLSFTPSQRKYFPLMHACKVDIWIVEHKEVENDYYLDLIMKPSNLRDYL